MGRRLAFASELKALLRLPEVEARIDWRAFGSLLSTLYTPADQSIVEGVKKLEPGHVLVAQAGRGVRVERYWDVRFEPATGRSEADLADELRGLLEESVRLHLVSDVPLGAFLSGGIDSSSVVALMSRSTGRPVKTFSIGFRDADFDETADARGVARALGTDHHEEILEPDIASILEEVAFHLDEPFGDSSAIPTYMVSKLAAGHVKVVLSGDGGDELFAGYDRYRSEDRDRRHGPLERWAMGRLGRMMPRGMRGRNRLLHLRGGRSKHILKRAMTGLLPESVLEKPKRGFAIPLGRWFRGPLRDLPRDLLLSERSRRRGIFDTAAIERLLADPTRGRDLDLPVWTLLSFELWCRAFLDGRPAAVASNHGDVRHLAPMERNEARRALTA